MGSPTAGQARALAETIHLRHLQAEDAMLEFMAAPEDLAGIVQYVCTHRQLPGDIQDALAIVWHLREELDKRELSLLHAAQRHNIARSELAPAMGLRGRNGVEMRQVRLEAAREKRVRRERDERAARRGETATGDLKGRWLKRERGRILTTTLAVLGAMKGQPWWSEDAADYAEELELLARDHDSSAGAMMALLALLVQDWEDSPSAPSLDVFTEQALTLANAWWAFG